MPEIKTYVYFDLEATGLKNSGKPRITELSLVAVNQQDVLDMHERINQLKTKYDSISDIVSRLEKLNPRVINKLTLCFYPMTTIMPGVTAITGLDNYNLSGQSQFDAASVTMINSFLKRLPEPVCLVAHNGDFYDFPLVMAEICKTGETISSDILCTDTYVGIKEIILRREKMLKEKLTEEEVSAAEDLIKAGAFDSDDDDLFMEASDENKRKVKDVFDETEDGFKKIKVDKFVDCYEKITDVFMDSEENMTKRKTPKEENETTPKRTSAVASVPIVQKSSKTSQISVKKYFKAKKRLSYSLCDTVKSYSLINLHKTLIGVDPTVSHGAEADCFTLMRVTSALGQDWITWAQDHCQPVSKIKPMWALK